MSFLDKIFGGDDKPKPSTTFWEKISSEQDLTNAVAVSYQRKVIIFKHSTRCHISKMVLQNFEREVEASDRDIAYYFLDLISFRDLSNKIAEDFGVTHQSPQIIVLENGKATKNASHQSITLSLA